MSRVSQQCESWVTRRWVVHSWLFRTTPIFRCQGRLLPLSCLVGLNRILAHETCRATLNRTPTGVPIGSHVARVTRIVQVIPLLTKRCGCIGRLLQRRSCGLPCLLVESRQQADGGFSRGGRVDHLKILADIRYPASVSGRRPVRALCTTVNKL